jgi:hypothetical protein
MWKAIKWFLRQLALTLYDDYDFQYISAPRVWAWLACIVVITAWIAEQFFNYKFAAWAQLVTWAVACLGAYGVKKVAERGENKNE